MITVTTLPTFPGCPTFGFTSEPMYLVKIVRREGGFERRDRKWAHPLHRYTSVPLGQRSQDDIEEVLHFWHALGGMSTMFRFKDWADYKSARLSDDITPADQPFTFIPGSPGGYQLIKQYAVGSLVQNREITKPKGDTIRVNNQAAVEQPSSAWTIEEDTGLLVPGGSFSGTPTSWGGEFYVPARFDSDLPIELTNHRIQSATFSLIEIRLESLT